MVALHKVHRSLSGSFTGIFFIDGEIHRNQKWFMLRYMRDFGFGRRHEEFEAHINEEIHSWINLIRDGPKYEHERRYVKAHGLAQVPLVFSPSIANCFLQVILRERIPKEAQAELFQ